MTVKHFRIFQEVYACCSFTKAAENLGMTQPAVSIAIREMEEHYNTQFFIRSKKALKITGDGQKMIHFANSVIRQMKKAEQAFGDGLYKEKLRIGSNVTSATSFLLNILLNNFQDANSDSLSFCINNSSVIEKMVYQGELDVGIIDIPTTQKDLLSIPVTTEEISILASPKVCEKIKLPLTPKDLIDLPLLLREEGSGTRECFDTAILSYGLHATPTIESTNNNTLISAARRGFGVLILPKNLVSGNIKKGNLKEIECDGLKLNKKQYFIIRDDTKITPYIKLLIEKLSCKFPESNFAKYYESTLSDVAPV